MEPKRKQTGRDGGRFLALPHVVLDSAAFLSLSFSARALLLDIARQYLGDNNGRLLASESALRPRGWNSKDTITRARRELEAAGLIVETRKGARPSKAAWFAVTWLNLDWTPDMDMPRAGYRRGLYLENTLTKK